MRLDVSSGTEEGSHVLCDPALPLDLHDVGDREVRAAFDREVEAGRALVFDTLEEEDALDYAVFVDEPLPPDLAARVTRLTPDVLLRAPAGRLLAGGVEELTITEEERAGTVLELPAGEYLVDVFRTGFGPEELDAALRADPGTAAGVRRERWAAPVGGLLLLCGFLACLVGLSLGLRVSGGVRVWGDPGPATTAAAVHAGGAGLGGLLLLGLGFGWLRLLLPGEDYRRRKRVVAARFPALALHLRPAPPGHGARGARIDLT